MSGFVTDHFAECCMCINGIDTREESEGGDPDCAEIGDYILEKADLI